MRVLMISTDKGLLGRGQLGDVVERHRAYGESAGVDQLDIIVLSRQGFGVYRISEHVASYPTNSLHPVWYGRDARRVAEQLAAKTQYDLIITQDPFFCGYAGARLKRRLGAKLLVHFHGDFWNNWRWRSETPYNWLFALLMRYVVRKADAFRVMSEGQKQKFVESGFAPEKVTVVSTPVDIAKFQTVHEDRVEQYRQTLAQGRPIVLHVGRNDQVKDFKTLLTAVELVSQHTSIHFWQSGAEMSAELLSRTVSATLTGRVSHEELIDVYHAASVVVLSSTSESFGKVLVEAGACGKPVIATATTGAQEIVQDGVNGFLVPIGDAEKLAEKITYLLEHREIAQAMGERGRKLVQERFGSNTEKIIGLWNSVVGK